MQRSYSLCAAVNLQSLAKCIGTYILLAAFSLEQWRFPWRPFSSSSLSCFCSAVAVCTDVVVGIESTRCEPMVLHGRSQSGSAHVGGFHLERAGSSSIGALQPPLVECGVKVTRLSDLERFDKKRVQRSRHALLNSAIFHRWARTGGVQINDCGQVDPRKAVDSIYFPIRTSA